MKNNNVDINNGEDLVDVTGIKKGDNILQIGKNLPFLKSYVNSSVHVSEIDSVSYADHYYQKIFVNGVFLDEEALKKLCFVNVGLLVFLDLDDESLQKLRHVLDTKWYPANTWELSSNIGKCLITDAYGDPITSKMNVRSIN